MNKPPWIWSWRELKEVDTALYALLIALRKLRLISPTAQQHAISCQTQLLETDESAHGDY